MTKAITLKDWSPDMPEHLSSYDALVQDIRSQLKGLSNSEKGDAFAHFVQELLPQSELNWQFEQPILSSKKSNDGGVDLTAAGRDGAGTLYIQSKQWIDRAEDIDGILTKFQDYLAQNRVSHNGMVSMFEMLDEHPAHFLIASLSPLENIRKKI